MDANPLIILTTDFSDAARRAYGPTIELAQRVGARIRLLHIVESLSIAARGSPLAPPQQSPEVPCRIEDAETQLTKEKERLGDAVPVSTEARAGESVAREVARAAEEHGAALVAVSTHGRTGWRHMILGSVAEGIVRRSKCPVLTFAAR